MKIFIAVVWCWLVVIPTLLFSQNDSITEIVILHVNDIHGRIDKMPYLATMVKDIESKHKNVFLLCAGDIFSGNPIVDKYSEKGFPMIDIMNMIPFSLSTLGNHEFDFGGEMLNKRLSEFKHPVIVSNISQMPTYFTHAKPYEILTANDVQVAVLGITQVSENNYPDTDPEMVTDFSFVDGTKSTQTWISLLKNYPVRIVLSHMGIEKDSAFAMQYPQFNAIIGGHSHKNIQPIKIINGVAIVQAECYLKYLGMMTIKVCHQKVISIKDTLLPIKTTITPDSVVLKKLLSITTTTNFIKLLAMHPIQLKGKMR